MSAHDGRGAVRTEEAFGALIALCQAPLPAARIILSQLAFAYGNGDAHAKTSPCYNPPTASGAPAPAYNLPSSQPYGDSTMALSIGGRATGDVVAGNFIGLGRELGVPERATRRLLTEVIDRSRMRRDYLDQSPFNVALTRKHRRVIDYRLRRFAP